MSDMTKSAPGGSAPALAGGERQVIFASSLGTVFEWYDFYLYGSLVAAISKHFFSALSETASFIAALIAFAAGFLVRPFGALVFGRLGDLVGRKYTFLVTILIMGSSTFLVGCLPSYATIGAAAPIILVLLRVLQGLALGGEYGGAATYVAEHAPLGKRGAYTSWIQTTATLGLFLSLIIITLCRTSMKPESFDAWGWRIPFLVSAVLLAISVWIRLKLNESPVFKRMKEEKRGSKAPLKESFAEWGNLKIVILALVGLTAGQAVVWYTGQFYALFFLTKTLQVDLTQANVLIAWSLILGTGFFIVFGVLSDKIGRKPIIMAGCLLAMLTYFPLFKALTHYANPQLEAAIATNPVVVVADPNECSFQFDLIGKSKFTTPCDVAKNALVKKGIPYTNEKADLSATTMVKVGTTAIPSYDGTAADAKVKSAAFNKALGAALLAAKYPDKADKETVSKNKVMIVLILFILVLYVTMVYGPIAAMLVEMFPARIRYSSMSLPYHIGNGWFGGLLPTTAFAIVAAKGDIYSGLWYPIIVAGMTLVIGTFFVKEKRDVDLHA
jgi:MFS family permease